MPRPWVTCFLPCFMNGYTLANHFRKLRLSFPFSATEADLFYELVALCNERSWPTEFFYSNPLLCAHLGMSESTLIRARNRLKQAGLLEFTSGHKRSPTVYRLLDPDAEIPLQNASKNASTSASISASKSASRSDTPYKEQTKRKTKTPKSAPADVSEEVEENSTPDALPAWQTWLLANAPEVLRLKTPLTTDQWTKLVTTYGEPLTQEVLLAMQNHAGLTKKYTSAYLTALDWGRRRQPTGPPKPAPTASRPPVEADPVLNYDFLAEQEAREQAEFDRQQAEWQATHAVAA
jgi:hypothetical protein